MCLTAFKAVLYMGEDGMEEEMNNNDRKMIRRPPPTDTDKWNALPEVPTRTEVGYLHLSFEYHRGTLRVRVWQISDLLLPPPQISMIHSIFVRGYFLPDVVHKTHRRTEEIVIGVPDPKSVDAAKTGIQHIFTPSSFKFKTPLMYTGVTSAIIKERSLQLEVCMTQKKTHRVFLMAMVHMPLRTAIRRPIREKYPLIPCMNVTTPNNMRVYSATHLQADKVNNEGEHSQLNGEVVSLSRKTKAEDELDDDMVSLSGDDFLRSHLSLCMDDGDDSDDDGLATLGGTSRWVSDRQNGSNSNGADSGDSSNTTLNMPSSGDELDGDEDEDNDVEYAGDSEFDRTLDSDHFMARSTPIQQGRHGEEGRTTASGSSKKKIIPDALLNRDILKDIASEDISLENGVGNAEKSSPLEIAGCESRVPPEGSLPPDSKKTLRRKIFPAEQTSTNASAEPKSSGSIPAPTIEISDVGDSSPQGDRKRQNHVSLENKNLSASQSSSQPIYNKHHISTSSSEGGAQLSPLQDSAFSPASRPETPCWDFYDFSDDLKPEQDLELAGLTLEDSLAQLRQHGIGSLQNLSMEPILPMDLKDDFDSLHVDAEQADTVELSDPSDQKC